MLPTPASTLRSWSTPSSIASSSADERHARVRLLRPLAPCDTGAAEVTFAIALRSPCRYLKGIAVEA